MVNFSLENQHRSRQSLANPKMTLYEDEILVHAPPVKRVCQFCSPVPARYFLGPEPQPLASGIYVGQRVVARWMHTYLLSPMSWIFHEVLNQRMLESCQK